MGHNFIITLHFMNLLHAMCAAVDGKYLAATQMPTLNF